MFPISALEMLDQANRHSGDFRIKLAEALALSCVEMSSSFGHGQMREAFFGHGTRRS
jgi:hypothetical protein